MLETTVPNIIVSITNVVYIYHILKSDENFESQEEMAYILHTLIYLPSFKSLSSLHIFPTIFFSTKDICMNHNPLAPQNRENVEVYGFSSI